MPILWLFEEVDVPKLIFAVSSEFKRKRPKKDLLPEHYYFWSSFYELYIHCNHSEVILRQNMIKFICLRIIFLSLCLVSRVLD